MTDPTAPSPAWRDPVWADPTAAGGYDDAPTVTPVAPPPPPVPVSFADVDAGEAADLQDLQADAREVAADSRAVADEPPPATWLPTAPPVVSGQQRWAATAPAPAPPRRPTTPRANRPRRGPQPPTGYSAWSSSAGGQLRRGPKKKSGGAGCLLFFVVILVIAAANIIPAVVKHFEVPSGVRSAVSRYYLDVVYGSDDIPSVADDVCPDQRAAWTTNQANADSDTKRGIDDYDIGKPKKNGSGWRVPVTLDLKDGGVDDVTVDVVKDAGSFYVCGGIG